MNKYNYPSNTRGKKLLLKYEKYNQVYEFHVPPDHRLAEPNISFNQSSLCHIPSINLGSHVTNPTKPNQGFHRPNHLKPQPMIPPHNQTSLTISRLISTQVVQGSKEFVPTRALRTSISTHICYRASRVFVQLGILGLLTQPTKGFLSVFPTKVSRTNNTTQGIIGLLECFSNQEFQELVTQPTAIRNMKTNQETKGKTSIRLWLSKKWKGQENPPSIQTFLHANNKSQPRNHMHMLCMPKLTRKSYMQLDTYK